jgi:mono/diheme cytochrome c family protein
MRRQYAVGFRCCQTELPFVRPFQKTAAATALCSTSKLLIRLTMPERRCYVYSRKPEVAEPAEFHRKDLARECAMRASALVSLFLLSLFPRMLSAQESTTKAPELDKTQMLGRRIFQQRCGVCHTQPTPSPMYGIALNKDLVDGNEDMIRDYIRNGSRQMPGFKYGLEPAEIDAIVEYLKTVPKPAPKNPQPKVEGPVD